MYRIKDSFKILLALVLVFSVSCHDLEEININPNGVDPQKADPNLLMATIITGVGQNVVDLGFGDIAGVMQHTQKDGWSGSHNSYEWDNESKSWRTYYNILRNIDEFYKKAVERDLEFHQGVAKVMEAYTFGLIADLYGDAPYSQAVKGEGGSEFFSPVFDPQRDIYLGILSDLETANTLLSKSQGAYQSINATQDVLFRGDAAKWRKFANSLALRYYMRISEKEPSVAEQGISNIYGNPSDYPLIISYNDDANMEYIGSSPENAWPTNTVFDIDPSGQYNRKKLCVTLVEALQALDDPRLGVWANKIEIPLVLDPANPDRDEIVDGKRYIGQNVVDAYLAGVGAPLNYDEEYVGLPPAATGASTYNLNPNIDQGTYNPHVSMLNDIYKDVSGPLLLARMMSASEVHFILAEAAMKGWISGDAQTHYNEGVKQSLNAWNVGNEYENYIANAPFGGLEELIEQKWIASWSAAAEAWFDYRRTGLPDLEPGEAAIRQALPLRFYYHLNDEIALNYENAQAAINNLETTDFTAPDGKNSAWSKFWLLQGTGKPW
ncbi:MAG: SusD/RagB family nutrient-binding outer membrane lipoprotein [Bacteroidales bacterium]|nr:SusD/RagB family nutrient-binding outer membrane lipoprotein [Bacteroidales bacterium]